MTEGKFRSETGQTRRNFEERMAQRVERRGARERERKEDESEKMEKFRETDAIGGGSDE